MSSLKDDMRIPVKIALGILLGFIFIITFNGTRHILLDHISQKRAESVNELIEKSGEFPGLSAVSLRQTSSAFVGPIRIPVKDYYVYISGEVESKKQREAAISLIKNNFDYPLIMFEIDIEIADGCT